MSNKCHNITKYNIQCGRTASYKIGCKLLCWQHAKNVKMFFKKGDKCNYKLLKKFDSIRKPYIGLGISGKVTGISGSLSVQSIFNIFKEMYEPNTCFIDVGAADGYMLIMSILYGYKTAVGIEFQRGKYGLQNIYDTIWEKIKQQTNFLKYNWSRKKPILMYNTNIKTMKISLNNITNDQNIHIFSFWDGFSQENINGFLSKLKNQHKIKRGCFVCRKSRKFGTFNKLQKELNNLNIIVNEINTIEVSYRKEKYNAIIVNIN